MVLHVNTLKITGLEYFKPTFSAQAVADGIMNVGLKYSKPVIFSVLTCNTMEQAEDRAGGKHGNKGVEGAISALKMLALENEL